MKALLVAALVLASTSLHGAGTVSAERIHEVLRQRPALEAFVTGTLDLRDSGTASRIGRHWRHLGGARIGPYQVDARVKGTPEYNLIVVLCTSVSFLDENGQRTKDSDRARSVRETLRHVTVLERAEVRTEGSVCGGAPKRE